MIPRRSSGAASLVSLVAVLAGVGLWFAVTELLAIPSYVLPSPMAVAGCLAETPWLYVENAWYSLRKVLSGGAVGVGAGFVLAVTMTGLPLVRRALFPYLVVLRVLPKIAIAPLFLIYVGTGFATATMFVALVTFFPMAVSTSAGLDAVPDRYLDLLESIDAGPRRRFLSARLPYALPDVFAGLKQSVTLAVIGAIVAEWTVAADGLGALVLTASETVQTDVMLAALATLFAIGLSLYGAVVACQRLVLERFGGSDLRSR